MKNSNTGIQILAVNPVSLKLSVRGIYPNATECVTAFDIAGPFPLRAFGVYRRAMPFTVRLASDRMVMGTEAFGRHGAFKLISKLAGIDQAEASASVFGKYARPLSSVIADVDTAVARAGVFGEHAQMTKVPKFKLGYR